MLPRSADPVVERMRHSCLDGVRLVSDRQPTRLRVDEHTSGPPAVWLHPDGSTTANSWQPHAKMQRALPERDTAIAERDRALSQMWM
jgi:hypothetical protein